MIGHKRITVEFSVNWLVAPFILAAGLITLFLVLPESARPALIFSAAVIAGAAALTTAINAVDARVSGARQARIQATLELVNRWNMPELHYRKQNCREVIEYFKANPKPDDQKAFLANDTSKLVNVFDLLNTFEALGLAVSENLTEEEIAKRFFRSMCVQYWHTFEGWIKGIRAERNNARLYQEFEALYQKWKNA